VCDNVGDHLLGNVYARYEWEAEAQKAVDDLNNRWYAGTFASRSFRDESVF
jgi:splicing factor U2AF subunit